MTIAISLKVSDGLVLAADSASTIYNENKIINVYNHANKVFNLYKGLPIGGLTWGAGSIGLASISTLVKDFRTILMAKDTDIGIDSNKYTIKEVIDKLKKFIYDEKYLKIHSDIQEQDKFPYLGFIVSGYSSNSEFAEEWRIDIINGKCLGPQLIRESSDSGITWCGEVEAISRLVSGFSPQINQVIGELGIPADQHEPIIQILQKKLQIKIALAPMPIQDAIDLAEFLAELTIKFSRFTPGAATVGGPIEIAVVTKHEGFKWVKRKHYFDSKFNPIGCLYENNLQKDID